MPLITTLEQFNQHVTVASDFHNEKFLKYTKKAEKNIIKLIGKMKYDEIVDLPDNDEKKDLLREYSANMGLSYALPAFVLNITTYGVFTNSTSDSQRAEWWQMKDLNRMLLKFAFTSLDDALQLIGVENTIDFNGLFVTTLKQFESSFSLGGSTQTFLSLIPFMREVQDQFLKSVLGDCWDYEFSEDQLKIIRAAIVNMALSKAATSGSFSIESNSMILRIEVLPWEKVEKIEQTALERFKQDRYNIGMGYMNQILKFVKELPCYQHREFISHIEKKASGLYL